MATKTFEISIPVLNEERRLVNGIRRTIEFLDISATFPYSIVIVDNGSTDRTAELSQSLTKEFPGKVGYLHLSQRGVGLALREAWSQSRSDIVGYMDIDLSTDLSHILEVRRMFDDESTTVVNGSRLLPGAKVAGRSFLREITSRGYNTLLKISLSVPFSDAVCGFKFLRGDLAKDLIASGINNAGWFFCTEILVKSSWAGIRIKEIPVCWSDDRDSKVNVIKLIKEYLKGILRLRRERAQWRLPSATVSTKHHYNLGGEA
jgi:glycosyltransferase involved in cell wall biosynthesis